MAKAAGPQFQEGSIEFSYTGKLLEMGGGLKIVNAEKGVIFDEQMLEPGMKFPSSKLEAVYAIPFEDSEVSVIVTNTTAQPIIVTGDAIFAGINGHHPIQSNLGPRQTQIVNLPRGLVKKASAGGVSLNHNGDKGALMAMIHLQDSDRGYSESVNFINPAGKTNERHGAGLRLGRVNNEPLRVVVAVRNIGDSATTVTATVPYSKQNGDTGTISLPQISLAPGEVKLLNTSNPELRRSDFDTAGLEIKYTGAPGSVIVTASSVSRSGNHVFALPMKDPQGGLSSTGGYPWFIKETSSTIVFIKNTTTVPRQFTLDIIYPGGQWGSNLRTLAPGQTFKLDVREVRDSQMKGSEGNTIPLDATVGHISWSAYGRDSHKTLIGRSQTVDIANGLVSTYECQRCCGNSLAGSRVMPGTMTGPVGYTEQFLAQEQDWDCYHEHISSWFNVNGQFVAVAWGSNDTNVMTVNSSGLGTAVGAGSTNIWASWPGIFWFADDVQGCMAQEVGAGGEAACDVKPFCDGKPLCTACESGGKACDGNGQCKTGKDLIPQICNQLRVTYANQQTPSCGGGTCGAVITYDITRVTHSCDTVSLGGAKITETITTDEGCSPGGVQVGPGCTINSDNTLTGCKDFYGLCLPASSYPSAGCTEVYTQKIFVGSCLAETRTITFKITKTPTSCSGTATRN